MKIVYLFSSVLFALLLSGCGCAVLPAHPVLSPDLRFQENPSAVQRGNIVIHTRDDRENKRVGSRGVPGMSASISIDDLSEVLKENFETMAKQRGYTPLSSGETSRRINVKLVTFNQSLVYKVLTFNFDIHLVMDVEATNASGARFSHLYQLSKKRSTPIAESETKLQECFTEALSELLSTIANDKKLWNFMAKG